MPTLNSALADLNQALEMLEAAAIQRAQADQKIATLEQQLAAALDDRAKLAQQLEAAGSQKSGAAPQQLELIERKIEGAINNIETVLAGKSNAA